MQKSDGVGAPAPGPLAHAVVQIDLDCQPIINHAAERNSIPVVERARISNRGAAALEHVRLELSGSALRGTGIEIDRLAAGETREIQPVDLRFRERYLSELAEATDGEITAEVRDPNGTLLGARTYPVALMAYDDWPGLRVWPGLLAAFSLPNHPVVERLVGRAARLLAGSDPPGALSGYQSGQREDVWRQVAAIYQAVAATGVLYSNPPASFEQQGQKIRTPDRMIDGGLGTCLDLAMLLTACLEQAGLHALVFLSEGHAWVGVWLVDTSLPAVLEDDLLALRKRVSAGEMLALEATAVASRPVPPFSAAVEMGTSHLLESETRFWCAVDIAACRRAKVRPLATRWVAGGAVDEQEPMASAPIEAVPELPPLDLGELTSPTSPKDPTAQRLAVWKSRLLDLTLRNRLLNFKLSRLSVRLVVPDPALVEDALASGRDWRFRSAQDLLSVEDPRSAALLASKTGEVPDMLGQYDWVARRELVVWLPRDTMQTRLLEMFRTARTGREEGGANTLFLTLGMLMWSEDGNRGPFHHAPILLVPVTMTRTSVRSHFGLGRHDDETLVNPTLLQLLRDRFGVEVRGWDPLPADDHGVDVERVLQALRLAVKDLPGFEVQSYCAVSLLSFAKHLMWRDLEQRADALLESHMVAHILGAGAPDPARDLDRRDDLDERLGQAALLAPLPADSAQLNVLARAREGHDLVIKGPPGTGKSQTITNLIANFLGEGKTVLFVSEKTAALQVVQRRLDALGLAPFCLELHSARSNKREVLNQLQAAFDAAGPVADPRWAAAANDLASVRHQLAHWNAVLHRRHANGLSLAEALETVVVERRAERFSPLPLAWRESDRFDEAALQQRDLLVEQLAARATDVSPRPRHPLQGLAATEWSSGWAAALEGALLVLRRAASDMEQALPPLQDAGWPLSTPASFAELGALADALAVGGGGRDVPAGVRGALNEATGIVLQRAEALGRAITASWERLAPYFRDSIAAVDATLLASTWERAQQARWLGKWRGERAVRATLNAHAQVGGRASGVQVADMLDVLTHWQQAAAELAALEPSAPMLLGSIYQGAQTNWDEVAQVARWHRDARRALGMLSGSGTPALARWAGDWMANGGADTPATVVEAWPAFCTAAAAVEALGGSLELADASDPVQHASRLAARWLRAKGDWRRWCGWQATRREALAAELAPVVAAAEDGRTAPADLLPQWTYSYRTWWARMVMDQEPELAGFSRTEQLRRIDRLRTLDERVRARAAQHLVHRLAAQVPVPATSSRDPAMRTLLRELQKQRQHLPVRVLLERLGPLLPRIKPCLLMSPLSAAQYLDADTRFDVVIFDEASQIAVWDAVGVMARGRQAIVVGDPKQLPPTQFFSGQGGGHDGEASPDTEDLESVLDECLGAGVPCLSLRWHYRSRHERLIAFSNQHYYGGQLITIPAPRTEDRAVRLVRVGGVYDRGGSRTNHAEALAVVDAIQAHFQDPDHATETLGVVTFNQPQQQLIETLLDQRQSEDAALEAAITAQGAERVFVKNLENVQGDERDVIFFSITFGRDAGGRMAMNFGPLNQAGGPRRLNVAVTRARLRAQLFASIGPEDIDLSRTRADGARDLRDYLAYATQPMSSAPATAGEHAVAGGLLADIQAELAEHGVEAHVGVGLSDFRVDLALVDPTDPDRYGLAVLTDGAGYAALPSVGDRELLRASVLTELGWRIHRTWALDWWESPTQERARIQHALSALGPP